MYILVNIKEVYNLNKKFISIFVMIMMIFLTLNVSSQYNETGPNIIGKNEDKSFRGNFSLEIGLRDKTESSLEIRGIFRNFGIGYLLRGLFIHPTYGNICLIQGITTEESIFLQTNLRVNNIFIEGIFTERDNDNQTFAGLWKGYLLDKGRTDGWLKLVL